MNQPSEPAPKPAVIVHPVRRALFRGLAVVLPPLLTLVIFLWIAGTLQQYILRPITESARWALVGMMADVRSELPAGSRPLEPGYFQTPLGEELAAVPDGTYVPRAVFADVLARSGQQSIPSDGRGVYGRWIEQHYLRPYRVVPLLLVVIGLTAYLLGAALAAGIGRMVWQGCERLIQQVPLVSNVYAAVKQVTDYLFSENELQFSRVVAVEYPRSGLWCVAFVTSGSFRDLRQAAGEPILAVFVPTSPVPFTGYVITYKKSEVVDLEMSIDEAFQYVISCGVVVPPEKLPLAVQAKSGGAALAASEGNAAN